MEEKRGAVDSALYFNLLLDQTSQTLTFKIKFATVRFNLLCLMVNGVRGTSTNWFPSRACAVIVCVSGCAGHFWVPKPERIFPDRPIFLICLPVSVL